VQVTLRSKSEDKEEQQKVSGYRGVIFDFGGVISTTPFTGMRAYCEEAGVRWDDLRQLLAGEEVAWSRWETNTISTEQFVQEFEGEAARVGLTVDARAFLKSFFAGMNTRPEMVAVVKALRQRPGLRVGCITNNTQSGVRNPLFDELFEVVVESSVVGMRKPDPRIYEHTCALLQLQPREAIFLDDLGINLKAARALGMATIKVDETTSAIDELEQLLGFPLPREAVAGG